MPRSRQQRTVEIIHLAKQDFLELLHRHPHLQNMRRQMQQRNLEAVIILEAPKQINRMTDFRGHGVVEGTDVLLIDETKCVRCNNCVSACAATHHGQTPPRTRHWSELRPCARPRHLSPL